MRTFAIAIGMVLLLIGAVMGLLATVVATVCTKCEAGQVATVAIVLFFMILPLGAWAGFSSFQNIQHARNMQSRREQPIEATYRELPYRAPVPQLPAPDDFIAVSDRMSVRQSQIENSATKVFIAMFPHTPPTRSPMVAAAASSYTASTTCTSR